MAEDAPVPMAEDASVEEIIRAPLLCLAVMENFLRNCMESFVLIVLGVRGGWGGSAVALENSLESPINC